MGFITISDEELEKAKTMASPGVLKVLKGFRSEEIPQRELSRIDQLKKEEKERKKKRAEFEKLKAENLRVLKKKQKKKSKIAPKHLIGDPAPKNPYPRTTRFSQPPVPMAITYDRKSPVKPRTVKTRSSTTRQVDYNSGLDAYDSYVSNIIHSGGSFGYGRKKSLEYDGKSIPRAGYEKGRRRKKVDYTDRWAVK